MDDRWFYLYEILLLAIMVTEIKEEETNKMESN